MKGKQPIFTPAISKCFCGADTKIIDWESRGMYRVMCVRNHILTKECATINRAVHRWNQRVQKMVDAPTEWWHNL
jgi:hypothetical protein